MDKDFNNFWDSYHVNEEKFPNRRAATFREWNNRSPMTRKAILEKVEKEGGPANKNPFFYVQDFPEPQPKFLRGDEDEDIVQVFYNGKYPLCSRQTAQNFGLTITKDPW